ncbi:MAG TPA: DUF559 domain-containing protein [Solirubrobacteraceae bacterium]|nr:DUF559 domain-containing protein [Solirubrobacteraceae bacterium]
MRQAGRITYDQLRRAGLSPDDVKLWIRRDTLIRTRPRVYALGYLRSDHLSLLWDGVLYAGPGARLAGSSAAHHLGLLQRPPKLIVVATPRKCRGQPGLSVLSHRSEARNRAPEGLPVSTMPEMLIELAAEGDFAAVRFVLANLEFRRALDMGAALHACQKGRPGSRLLRRALAQRLPQLAHCRSPLEVAFLLLLEAHGLALPDKVNVWLHGVLIDMYWAKLGLVVELDGKGNHSTQAQKRRDAVNEATLAAHGIRVLRLDWDAVHNRASATVTRLAGLGVSQSHPQSPTMGSTR